MAAMTGHLAADALRIAGLTGVGPVSVLPLATGMALTLVLLALRPQRPSGADVAIWSRIDQKTCLKAITAAGLRPHVVELRRDGDQLVTDVQGIADAIQAVGAERVVAVVTTTSCFAPRAPDDVAAVARLAGAAGVPHVVNNAYGVQSRATCAAIAAAWSARGGRVDAIVQSTDKNFMVPVGGALVAAPAARPALVAAVNCTYPGRAGVAAHLDLLMTLLHWGAEGWRKVLAEREELVPYLRRRLGEVGARHGERLLDTPGNPISMALTLDTLAAAAAAAATASASSAAKIAPVASAAGGEGNPGCEEAAADGAPEPPQEGGAASGGARAGPPPAPVPPPAERRRPPDVTFFGSMLWSRCVSGTRVVAPGKTQSVGGVAFRNYGSHTEVPYPSTYMTAAAALGTTRADVDELVVRLDRCFAEFRKKCGGGGAAAAAAASVAHSADAAAPPDGGSAAATGAAAPVESAAAAGAERTEAP